MITANLTKPLTTDEAIAKFECNDCKAGNTCEWNCVESATCSLRCKKCGERNWFAGDLPRKGDGKWEFVCRVCGVSNSYSSQYYTGGKR